MRIIDFVVSTSAEAHRGPVRLVLRTDTGAEGVAETSEFALSGPLIATLDGLKAFVVGTTPESSARTVATLLGRIGLPPGKIGGTAVGLIEIACRSIEAETLGIPLHRLMGGAIRNAVRLCAIDWEPERRTNDAFSEAASRVVEIGYRTIRLAPLGDLGGRLARTEMTRTLRLCEAVRAAVGPDVEVWVDFEGKLTVDSAIAFAQVVERIDPAGLIDVFPSGFSPEPMNRSFSPLGVGTGIHHWMDACSVLDRRSVILIRFDPIEACGLGVSKTLAALAETRGVEIGIRTGPGICGFETGVQLGSTLPNLRFVERIVSPTESTSHEGVVDGCVPVYTNIASNAKDSTNQPKY